MTKFLIRPQLLYEACGAACFRTAGVKFICLLGLSVLFSSCDNGNADVKLYDTPPSITVVKPLKYTSNVAITLKATFKDGADPSLSKSPLASGTWKITNTTFSSTLQEGNLTLSGVKTDVAQPVTALPVGSYKLILTALDKNNNSKKDTTTFTVLSSVAIIGDATPNGWNNETPMTRSDSDPDIYTITLTLSKGEAKFRANNAWAINWGVDKFPSGTGTQDGKNIPVAAGRYKITFNISTGEFKFEAQ